MESGSVYLRVLDLAQLWYFTLCQPLETPTNSFWFLGLRILTLHFSNSFILLLLDILNTVCVSFNCVCRLSMWIAITVHLKIYNVFANQHACKEFSGSHFLCVYCILCVCLCNTEKVLVLITLTYCHAVLLFCSEWALHLTAKWVSLPHFLNFLSVCQKFFFLLFMCSAPKLSVHCVADLFLAHSSPPCMYVFHCSSWNDFAVLPQKLCSSPVLYARIQHHVFLT